MKRSYCLPLLLAICITLLCFRDEQKVTIYSIGDSTMCDFSPGYLNQFGGDNYPIRGWMQMMPQFFDLSRVTIHNAARSGRSSKSFRNEGFWKPVIANVKPGDYVFIMFGGNDQKPDTARHTDPRTTYWHNMKAYVEETRAKGAYPILFTSIVRREFEKDGKLKDTYGDYVVAIRDLAREMNVPLIDLYQKTRKLVEDAGPEESKKFFLNIPPGRFTKLPEGKQDNSHLCILGATKVAVLAAEGLKEIKSPLAEYLK